MPGRLASPRAPGGVTLRASFTVQSKAVREHGCAFLTSQPSLQGFLSWVFEII